MSGTSYGACILHVSPESYIGGPLALVQNGDLITLDVDARTINLDVPEAELAERRAAWKPPEAASSAAMAGCSPSTSGRPTKAAISISSRPVSARRSASRRFIDAVVPGLMRSANPMCNCTSENAFNNIHGVRNRFRVCAIPE